MAHTTAPPYARRPSFAALHPGAIRRAVACGDYAAAGTSVEPDGIAADC